MGAPWRTTNSILAIPLLPPLSTGIGARSEGVCIKLPTLPGARRRTLVRNALCGIPIGSGVDVGEYDSGTFVDNKIRPTCPRTTVDDIRLILFCDRRKSGCTPRRPAVFTIVVEREPA